MRDTARKGGLLALLARAGRVFSSSANDNDEVPRGERSRHAREEERSAAARLERLQTLAEALSGALTAADVAGAALGEGLPALAAQAGSLMLLSDDGTALEMLDARGYPGSLDPFRRLPIDAPYPLTDAVRLGAAVWVQSRRELVERYPSIAVPTALGTNSQSIAAVPMLIHDTPIGALGLSFREERTFAEGERAFLAALARQCGQALERARLYEAERKARARLERMIEEARFLAEASAALAGGRHLDATLQAAARLGVPRIADGCIIDLVPEGGELPRTAVAHADPAQAAALAALRRRAASERRWITTAFEARQPLLIAGRDAAIHLGSRASEEHARIAPHELLCVPLLAAARQRDGGAPTSEAERADPSAAREPAPSYPESLVQPGALFGVLSFLVTTPDRRFKPEDVALAEELARRVATAVEGALLHAEMQRAVQTRKDMLAIVSHDLRNSLEVVAMGAALIERSSLGGDEGEVVRRQARRIARAADEMTRLIRDLLDAASIEAGRLRIEPSEHDVEALVAEVVELYGPLAAGRSLELSHHVAAHGAVTCDRSRILQVFSNLLGNALKFTPTGGRIAIAATRESVEVRFSVTDTGPGIPGEQLPRLFDRYFRGKPAGRGGTGLGLFIAKGIVEAHGGTIGVSSAPGAGSTFFFTLPAAPG